MSETPQFDISSPTPPPPEKRIYYGWIAIALIVSLMFAVELAGYLGREPKPKDEATPSPLEQQLKLTLGLRQLALQSSPQGSFKDPLEDHVHDLASQRQKSTSAARLYAALRYEQGAKLLPEDISILRDSKNEVDRAFFQLYSNDKLTPAAAKGIAERIPDDKFLYQLAEAHAYKKAGDPSKREGLVSTSRATLAVLLIAGGCLATLLGLGGLVAYAALRNTGRLEPLGMPAGLITRTEGDLFAIRAAQLFAIFVGTQLLVGIGFAVAKKAGYEVDDKVASLIMLGMILVSMLLIFRLPVHDRPITLERIGLTKRDFGKHVLWGIGGAFANIPIIIILGVLGMLLFRNLPPAEHPITSELQAGLSPFAVIAIFIQAAVFAPLLEEIMFRGALFSGLVGAMQRLWPAVLLQGFMFAVIHPTGIPAWLPLAAVGCMGALLTYQTKSLIPAIVMHAVHNTGTLLVVLLISG